MESLAGRALDDPIKIVTGRAGEASEDVSQYFLLVPHRESKWLWLQGNFSRLMACMWGSREARKNFGMD